jgi:hypothetical protein
MSHYFLKIPAGTKVLSKQGMVELIDTFYIGGAIREEDGAYRYTINNEEFICAGGCCEAWEALPEMVRHKDGLIWIG